VKERFYPFVEARGFVRDPSRNPLSIVFRRITRETVHVFAIQWDKYHAPRFALTQPRSERSNADVRVRRGRRPVDRLFPRDRSVVAEKSEGPHIDFVRRAI